MRTKVEERLGIDMPSLGGSFLPPVNGIVSFHFSSPPISRYFFKNTRRYIFHFYTPGGTSVIIFNLQKCKDSNYELTLSGPKNDICLYREKDPKSRLRITLPYTPHRNQSISSERKADYSLRAYCSVMFYTPPPNLEIYVGGLDSTPEKVRLIDTIDTILTDSQEYGVSPLSKTITCAPQALNASKPSLSAAETGRATFGLLNWARKYKLAGYLLYWKTPGSTSPSILIEPFLYPFSSPPKVATCF